MTIPCYFVGAVTYMGVAWLSDRQQKRGLFCVIFGCVSVVGYGILLSDSPAGVHYFGYGACITDDFICLTYPFSHLARPGLGIANAGFFFSLPSAILVATGLYVVVGLPLAWLPNNSPRYGKRTTANGMQLTMGNASGIMTPFI